MDVFLLLAFMFLGAGVIAVPIASRLGLGSVLGYLLAGIALSPVIYFLNYNHIAEIDVVAIQHFAEFGVVMMLFLVGLELEPEKLWKMRNRLLGLGGLQVGVTTLIIMAASMVMGQYWTIALAIGLTLALSSTAIVLQTLSEKGLMKSDAGQGSFSVLLFQDIAVIPILALIPLLAMPELMDVAADAPHHGDKDDHGSMSLVAGLGAWQRTLITLGAIGSVILVGNYLTRPLFRFIAWAKLRELFVASALAFVIGIALLMSLVGLSPALGTFLAGVVLANSEYRHELESDIEPFKGLLLGVFFITVGANINFGLLVENFGSIIALTLGLIAVKVFVLLSLAKLFKIPKPENWLFALGLAQAGEFGFVLLSFTVANNVIPKSISQILLLIVALSMLLTPLLFIIYDKLIAPRHSQEIEREADHVDEKNHIIIAGHGRFGGIVNRAIRFAGYEATVLDFSAEQLDMISMFGIKAYYGDATRPDMLHAAGIEHAKVLIIAIDDKEHITRLTHYVHQNYPHVHIVARAVDRPHVFELWEIGCRDIIRETYDSSVRAGRSVLEALGYSREDAQKMVDTMEEFDRGTMPKMAGLYKSGVPLKDNKEFVKRGREIVEEFERQVSEKTRVIND